MTDERVERLRQELMGDLLTVDEVAEVLGLERSTVMRYLREHRLIGLQIGRVWRIPEGELRTYIERLQKPEVQP